MVWLCKKKWSDSDTKGSTPFLPRPTERRLAAYSEGFTNCTSTSPSTSATTSIPARTTTCSRPSPAASSKRSRTLKQCLEKGDVDEYDIEIRTETKKGKVEVDDMPRTADIRITDIHTDITVEVPPEHEPRATRCLDIFERHCPISQSVDARFTLHTSDSLSIDDS